VDKVTQQNAASAEESASAAEEMNAQAEQMRIFVNELIAMVKGAESGGSNGNRTYAPKKNRKLRNVMHRLQEHAGQFSAAHLHPISKQVPDQDVALDHADLKAF
jgi:methyl-accepting chemotaxis protein